MKKVAIICFSNLYNAPVEFYIDFMNKNNIDYDVIYWNRDGIREEHYKNLIGYNLQMSNGENYIKKFYCMMRYAKFVKKTLNRGKYKYCIVSTTLLAYFLYDILKKYQNRFLLDIRDHTYEQYGFYFKKLKKICQWANVRVVSSPDFVKFLPKQEYLVCHNLNEQYALNPYKYKFEKNRYLPLEIGFVGIIRYKEKCLELINNVKKNKNFILSFYGTGHDEKYLKEYVEKYKIENVNFYGKYDGNAEKTKILRKVDILANLYGNDTDEVVYALSNKSYDAAFYKKLILVNEKTSMERFTEGYNFIVKDTSDFIDELYEFYYNIDECEFNNKANACLKKAIEDNECLSNTLRHALEVYV